jgi:hypothetical protein
VLLMKDLIALLREANEGGYMTCPECGEHIEVDCPECSCGWENELMANGMV